VVVNEGRSNLPVINVLMTQHLQRHDHTRCSRARHRQCEDLHGRGPVPQSLWRHDRERADFHCSCTCSCTCSGVACPILVNPTLMTMMSVNCVETEQEPGPVLSSHHYVSTMQ